MLGILKQGEEFVDERSLDNNVEKSVRNITMINIIIYILTSL